MLVLLMGTGLLLIFVTGGVQFRHLGTALGEVLGKLRRTPTGATGNVRPFAAVATALASTVGVGNIAGVATALTLGGPGALFWLWVSGIFGMGTKFAEIVIALHYREPDAQGIMRGGAMYTLKKRGLGWLGTIFALLTALAAFGIGNMVQANSVAQSLNTTFGVSPALVGGVLVVSSGAVILGGIRRIAAFAEWLVPFMAIVYIVGGLVIVLTHLSALPGALRLVFEGAFTGTAATGGFAGATIMAAMRYGVARGLFSNEAGLGSAPMVHSAANTDHPVRQGLYGIFEVFVDTILICTTTGLVILVTGTWDDGATGAALSVQAFETGLPGTWGDIVVTTGLVLFAFSTLIGWSYYGETGIVYLLGTRAAVPYRVLWLVFIYLGAVGSLQLVWSVADTLNGLMAMPNLVSVLISIPLLRKLQKEFFARGGVRGTRGAGAAAD
ncbi:MAG: sodium:alanine symporter family protein [Gemmatimonadota bacterium]|nr:sodium:alanine symporter family protein [Gemmatimonadota bacterium]